MTSPNGSHDGLIADALEALEHGYIDAEEQAMRLGDVPVSTLDQYRDRLSDAIFWMNAPSAMRILNVLPAPYTKRHAENYIYQLDRTGEPAYAAGVFVTFKARSTHRTRRLEWSLDKALWKWMRHSDSAALEEVSHRLGPDWSTLWPDHVAVVFGSGRITRRLYKITAKMRQRVR